MSRHVAIALAVSGVLTSSCGGSSGPGGAGTNPTAPSPPPMLVTRTYTGVLVVEDRPGKSGAFDLTAMVPAGLTAITISALAALSPVAASGTLVTPNATVSLSGTFDPETSTFAVSGFGYQISAVVNADGELLGTGMQLAESTPLRAVGFTTTASSPAARFCGTSNGISEGVVFNSGYFQNDSSTLDFTISGTPYATDLYGVLGASDGSTFRGWAHLFGGVPSQIGTGADLQVTVISGGSGSAKGSWLGGYWSGNYAGNGQVTISGKVIDTKEYGNWVAYRC